jgi:type VI secretion system protein ImpA
MTFLKRLFGQSETAEERVRVIDLDALLKEIEADFPSGPHDLEYDPAFIALEQMAAGTPEKRVGDRVVEERRDPPWREVKAAALALLGRSHDLRIVMALLRTLLHTDGLPGLRDGLELLDSMIERDWATLYPQLDPDDNNDPTQRVNILMTLCDRELLLLSLMDAPLCSSRAMGTFTLRDIHLATGKITVSDEEKEKAASTATINAAFQDTRAEELTATATAIAESLECVTRVETFLTELLGSSDAPHFAEIRQVLQEMNAAVSRYQISAGETAEDGNEPLAKSQSGDPGKSAPPSHSPATLGAKPMEEIANRQDVINLLEKICAYYEQNEPASPVPLLLKRAMRLVEKDFLTIMEDLVPDSLAQIKLISGIKNE